MGLFEGVQSADSAGRKLKQSTMLFAAARRWLVSVIMFLGISLSKQNILSQLQ
jgi:hypothetical protein